MSEERKLKRIPYDREVNDGFKGPLNYDSNFVDFLKQIRSGIEEVYPVTISISVANPTDKRWENWRNYDGKEKPK